MRRDEAILFILSAPLGIEPRSPRPQRGIRAPRDQDQGPSTRRFSQARARVANLPPGVRTPRRGDSRISRAAIADGRPTTPPRDPHGANDRRVQRRPRWGAPPPTRAAIPTRRPAAPPRATGRHANARRSAGTSASPRRSADRTRSASATPSTTTNGTRARASEPPVVRPSRSPARARRRNTREFFVIEHPKRLLSPSLLTDSSPLLSPPTSQTREGKTPRGETFPQTPTEGPARRAHSLRRRRRRRRRDSARAYASRARKTFRSRRRRRPRAAHRVSDRRAKSRRRARRRFRRGCDPRAVRRAARKSSRVSRGRVGRRGGGGGDGGDGASTRIRRRGAPSSTRRGGEVGGVGAEGDRTRGVD